MSVNMNHQDPYFVLFETANNVRCKCIKSTMKFNDIRYILKHKIT